MVLGQILTNNTNNLNVNDFIRVTTDKRDVDNNIPTLVVGKKNIFELFDKSKIKYLDRKINDNIYWTFAKTERRDEYEKDLEKFNKLVIDKILASVEYRYINLIYSPLSDVKLLISILSNNDKKTVLIHNDLIYVYYNCAVYAFSLIDAEYIGVGRNKIIKQIMSNRNNIMVKNKYNISKDIKSALKDNIYLIPYIYFLDKTNQNSI